ncbi:ATP-binding protein [Luteolibacter luteus]|uniref:histidine kinase n=1 Tax=Luteolibacter luteus TaxID=2728835 RepID=A0A858RKW4_9BACT|nr:ATP-binding protein [Luteolibacter luteus]QJE97492.1 HAMP domain-containing protein [Luteolibacter luteus]
MKRFWMRSLTGQWITLMLLALALSQVLFLAIYRGDQLRTVFLLRRDEFLARAASVARLLDAAEPTLHPGILDAANTVAVRYWVGSRPEGDPLAWEEQARARLMESTRPPPADDLPLQAGVKWETLPLEEWKGGSPAMLVHLPDWNGFGLATEIGEGRWLNAVYAKPGSPVGPPGSYYVSMAITAVLLCVVTALIANRVGRPLRRLTDAAEKLGRGEETDPLPEDGADDIRRTATAFNRMQSRLKRYVEDRTGMMAAISHDLRTPITSLRLQAEFVSDDETRDKLVATLDEMKAITEASLAFAREEAASEATRSVDMEALLESLCEDLSQLGWEVEFVGSEAMPWRCRPDSLRRALRNVIENAVRYGGEATVSMKLGANALEIFVDDDGPGISEADRERVFAPFVRLESSRNRATGGTGLGLPIARTILRNHGGDLVLANRKEGGLRAVLHLPRD